jgi:hypothetical protein
MQNRLAITASCCAVLGAATASAQTLVRSVSGPAASAQYGKACIVVPDQNSDGYKDLLVGAPGFNQQRGEILCLSGAFLSTGTGTQTIWSLAPTAQAGDQFGYSIAAIGDVTSDGVGDYIVGQPGYDTANSDEGAIRLLNGVSHTVGAIIHGGAGHRALGSAVAGCGDFNADGKPDVIAGAPGTNGGASYVFIVDGWMLTSNVDVASASITSFTAITAGNERGACVAGGFDLNGDGLVDFAYGEPGWDNGTAIDAGRIVVGFSSGGAVVYSSPIPGERLGDSLSVEQDFDGDGVLDLVVGAPDSPTTFGTPGGRVVVLSGARLVAQTPPYEIYTFTTGGTADYHFGTAVRAVDDLNNDGVPDILGGEPDFLALGGVRIFSGASGAQIAFVAGAAANHLGDAIAGAVEDFDGDGFKEFVVAGSSSDAGGTDIGVVKCYRLFPLGASTYCTGKINSQGCTPAISTTGSASETSASPFTITASNFVNQKNGLLFYSHAPTSSVFQGGFKCVADPVVRTTIVNSGGSTSGSDCTGSYSFEFNALIQSGNFASLVAGAEVYAQWWSRDPASASHTSLSNAVQFVINP